MHLNYAAIAVATGVAFIASAIYYILFAKQRAALSSSAKIRQKPQPALLLAEVIRTALLTVVLAWTLQHLTTTGTVAGGLRAGALLWLGFPVVLLSGSVIYEKISWKLAALHAGDWLIKLLLVCWILTLWK